MAISSGAIGVIGTGVVAACGTILAGLASESFKRHKEVQSLAIAIYCEIDLTIEFINLFVVLDEIKINDAVKKITEEEKWNKSRFMFIEFNDPIIYKKLVEKIGYFPVSSAGKIVAFYSNLLSLEHRIRITYTSDNLELSSRIKAIQSLPKEWTIIKNVTRPLMAELKMISKQQWKPIRLVISLLNNNGAQIVKFYYTVIIKVKPKLANLYTKRKGF